jgi:hypothetical protein
MRKRAGPETSNEDSPSVVPEVCPEPTDMAYLHIVVVRTNYSLVPSLDETDDFGPDSPGDY